jgi:hypothetical protein
MPITHPPAGSSHRLRQAFSAACRLTGPLEVSATHRGSGAEQRFVIRRPYTFVGRGASSEVRLNDPSVSRPHAFLQVVDGRVYCADLGSHSGLVWDDGRCGPGWLGGEQRVRIGTFDLKVIHPTPPLVRRAPGSPPGTPERVTASPPAPSLEVYRGADSPIGVCPLDWPVTLVGRHPACRLRFVDSTVEYFQGCVVNTPDGIWWIDFSRRRTSLVNGQRARLARLRECDMLEIGRVTLVPRKAEPVASPADGALVKLTTTTAMVPPPGETVVSASALAPMMAELRQCVAAMAQTFAALQQEHAAAVSEHLTQIRELTRELRQLRGEGVGGAVVPPNPSTPRPPRPTPTAAVSSDAADKAVLTDAHAWFMDQLVNLGQPAEARPKRRA